MSKSAPARWLLALISLASASCADSSLVLKGQLDKFQQQQTSLARQKDELQNRATGLDRDNQDLMSQVTQERQLNKALEDQLVLVRDRLAATNGQLARMLEDKKTSEQKVQALTASLQRQGGSPIVPNNSLLQTLPAINLPDVNVRKDGDVIRVELPAHRLFEPGNARLLPGAADIIVVAAREVLRSYPNQILGLEGHTDSDPISNRQWANHHQLSIGRALAVYDVLVQQARTPPGQLFVVGHGANHPLFSNATPAGKQRNARVELVVYPETVATNRQVQP